MSERFVLDASALLAFLHDEPGARIVEKALPLASISSVNFAEVVSKMTDANLSPEAIDDVLDPLDLHVIAFDKANAIESGVLRRATRAISLSLGDRACIAVARALKATVLTADRSWAAAELGCKIEFVR